MIRDQGRDRQLANDVMLLSVLFRGEQKIFRS